MFTHSPIDEGGIQLYPDGPREYATDLPHGLPNPSKKTRAGWALHLNLGSRAPHTDPCPPGFGPVPHNEASDTDFSRIPSHLAHHARPIWQYWNDVTSQGRLPPAPSIPPGAGCPVASPGRCDSQATEVSHLRSENKRLTAHRLHVVGVTPINRAVAAGESATAITQNQGAADGGGGGAG